MNRQVFAGVVLGVLVLAGVAGIGVAAYDAGVAQGAVQTGQVVVHDPGVVPAFYGYRPHFWFPFGFLVPIFSFLLIFGFIRFFFFAGRRHRWDAAYGYQGDVPPTFERWHQKLHETPSDE